MKYSETYSSNEFLPISAQKFDILTFLGPIRVLAPNLDYSCMMYIVHILEICGRICGLHCVSLTEKYFRNLIKSNPNQILFTMHRLIWNQTDVRLVQNKSVHGKCNLILLWFIRFRKDFSCVYALGDIHSGDFSWDLWLALRKFVGRVATQDLDKRKK